MSRLIARLARQVDSVLRHFDFSLRRTDGGMLGAIGVPRHPPGAIIMPGFVAATLVHGPATSCSASFASVSVIVVLGVVAVVIAGVLAIKRGWLGPARQQLALLIVTMGLAMLGLALGGGCGARFGLAECVFVGVSVLLYGAMRFVRVISAGVDLVAQLVVLGVVAGAVWLAGGAADALGQAPYRHVLVAIFPLLAVATAVAYCASAWSGRRWSSRYSSMFRPMLSDVELFVARPAMIPVTGAQVAAALVVTPLHAPLQLLWLPAVAILVGAPDQLYLFGGVALAMAWLVLALAQLDDRLQAVTGLLWASFFHGAALLSSLLTIGLAAARLAGVSYVTTLLDSDLWPNLALYLVAAYALTWWYDYWQGRATAEQALRVLGVLDDPSRPVVPYPVDQSKTAVPAAGRVIQLHGSGRLAVVCDTADRVYFETYLPFDLLRALIVRAPTGARAERALSEMQKEMAYGHAIAALVLVASLGGLGMWLHAGVQSPLVVMQHDPGTNALTVEDLLFGGGTCGERPVLAVTASGGGTRAATFTAAILEDLRALDLLRDVRLVGGVSGGGAALAYFAGHRPELLRDAHGGQAWERFIEVMQMHYIFDVIEGASEARLLGATRLGNLLAESFERHWQLGSRQTLGDIRDVGLLLNTSIEGDLTVVHRNTGEEAMPFEEVERHHRAETLTTVAGGRLVFTNLHLEDDFPLLGIGMEEHRLPIAVVRDTRAHGSVGAANLGLARAAAAAANFPPVFANAAIDVVAPQPSTSAEHRYWVTDGGALENRGLESMLYALEDGLQRGLADPNLRNGCGGLPPSLDLAVIEASATSQTYAQSRGTNSMMAAGTTFGSQLAAELVRRIEAMYPRSGERRFKVHYLAMPIQLRRAGAFGTNWMLQPWVKICRSERPGPIPCNDECVELTGAAVVQALRALYDPNRAAMAPPREWDKVRWLRDEREYKEEWNGLVAALSPVHP